MNACAIYKKEDGSYFFNPNCYFVSYKKGQVTSSGALCVEDNVTIKYAEKFVKENNPAHELLSFMQDE